MFLVLSLTVSGSLLALSALALQRLFGGRLGRTTRWLWLAALLRLCLPLPGPVNLIGDGFQDLQTAVWEDYTQAEEEYLLRWNRHHTVEKLVEIDAALPEDAWRLPFGSVEDPVPMGLPISPSLRARNPNTWLALWAAGAAFCFLWSLFHYRGRPLAFKWFTAAVLSLHWFNPLMLLIRRELMGPAPEAGRAQSPLPAVLCTAALLGLGLILGALPGGLGTSLFHGADHYVLGEVSGKAHWDAFLSAVEDGRPAGLRTIRYYPSDQFQPASFYLWDVYYDGRYFQIWEPGADHNHPNVRKTYGYLNRYDEAPGGPGSQLQGIIKYILVDDPTLTQEDLGATYFSVMPEPAPKQACIFSDMICK